MQRSYSWWLTGIIVLTVLSFLVVFKPITFAARKDPSDANLYLRPVNMTGKFDAERPPEKTLSFLSLNIFVYKPQQDLRLGMDLRGGMRVVLEIPDRALFRYALIGKTADDTTEEQRSEQQSALLDALSADNSLGPDATTGKVKITVNGDTVDIATQPRDSEDAKFQKTATAEAMDKVFGAGKTKLIEKSSVYEPKQLDKQRAEFLKNVQSIMEVRLNKTGLTEVTAYSEGTNRVVLEIPGVKDPEQVKKFILAEAALEFRLVPKSMTVDTNEETGEVTVTRNGQQISTEEALTGMLLQLSGSDLNANSEPTYDQQHRPAVSFSVKSDKAPYFGRFTSGHKGYQMAIVLDKAIVMAPVIQDRISDRGIITGNFTMQQVQDWATLLNAGALPVPVSIAETRIISATLGADSVAKSLFAGIIGFIAVLIFMAAYYRLPGLMANLALTIYVFLSLAVLKLFDATLTLPGIAGIIISIGMAVDANVIIFERLKEELKTKKPLETAIDVAFQRAWTAILDSNVASLITGSVLYSMGTGAVKGFAITLVIGVAVSMFTAVTVTRLFMKLMIRSKAAHNPAWYGV